MKFAAMRELSNMFSISRMAKFLKVSRSAYYEFCRSPERTRCADDSEMEKLILDIYQASKGRYGLDRIHQELRKKQVFCHRRRVSRIMAKLAICGKIRPKKVQATDSRHDQPIAPNLLDRNFTAAAANQVWVSDITYVATMQGWLYLCTIIDLFSRKVVGWSMSASLATEFVTNALEMAVQSRRPEAGLIFHSDRGVQYVSGEFREVLSQHNIVQSMSRKANCLDNACAESFFSTLKREIGADIFWNRAEARAEIFDYIECFYNRTRSHSYLGYVSPEEFEMAWQAA